MPDLFDLYEADTSSEFDTTAAPTNYAQPQRSALPEGKNLFDLFGEEPAPQEAPVQAAPQPVPIQPAAAQPPRDRFDEFFPSTEPRHDLPGAPSLKEQYDIASAEGPEAAEANMVLSLKSQLAKESEDGGELEKMWDDLSLKKLATVGRRFGQELMNSVGDLAQAEIGQQIYLQDIYKDIYNPANKFGRKYLETLKREAEETIARNTGILERLPEVEDPAFKSILGQMIEGGFTGTARFAPTMITTIANPAMGYGMAVAQIAGAKRAELKKKGKSDELAWDAAIMEALPSAMVETASNVFQVKAVGRGLNKIAAKVGLGQKARAALSWFLKSGTAEGVEELTQKQWSHFTDAYVENSQRTPEEIAAAAWKKIATVENLKSSGMAFGTGFAGGVMFGGAAGMAGKAASLADKTAKKGEAGAAPEKPKGEVEVKGPVEPVPVETGLGFKTTKDTTIDVVDDQGKSVLPPKAEEPIIEDLDKLAKEAGEESVDPPAATPERKKAMAGYIEAMFDDLTQEEVTYIRDTTKDPVIKELITERLDTGKIALGEESQPGVKAAEPVVAEAKGEKPIEIPAGQGGAENLPRMAALIRKNYLPDLKDEDIRPPSEVTEQQKVTHQLADIWGIKSTFYSADEGRLPGDINGLADQDNRRIFINENAAAPELFVLGHESFHILETEHHDLWEQAMVVIEEEAANLPQYKALLERDRAVAGAGKGEIDRELVRREFGADVSGEVFTRPTFWKKLNQRNPEIFKALADIVRRLLLQVKRALKSGTKAHGAVVKNMERVEKAIADAYGEAARREQKPAAEERTTKVAVPKERRKSGEKTRKQFEAYREMLGDSEKARELFDELIGMVYTDSLMGIGSKRAFFEALAENSDKTVVMVDIDNFSWFNDALGHPLGDEILAAVGKTMQSLGVDVYRVGGEELAILAEEEAAATQAVNQLRRELEDRLIIEHTIGTDVELKDGTTYKAGDTFTIEGVGISYGIGKTYAAADEELKLDKGFRTAQGLRATKGAEAGRVSRVPGKAGGAAQKEPGKKPGAPASVKKAPRLKAGAFTVKAEKYAEKRGDDGPFHDTWRVYDANGNRLSLIFTSEGAAEAYAKKLSTVQDKAALSVKSKAFKKWFGKSVVKDEDGEPLMVFHGTTSSGVTEFATGPTGRMMEWENFLGPGAYFTDSVDDANENYATDQGPDITSKIAKAKEGYGTLEDYDPDDPRIREVLSNFLKGITPSPWSDLEKIAETVHIEAGQGTDKEFANLDEALDDEEGLAWIKDNYWEEAVDAQVRSEMALDNQGALMPVFLKMVNPLDLSKTKLTYELELSDDGEDVIGESGSAVDMIDAIEGVLLDHDVDSRRVEGVRSYLSELALNDEGITGDDVLEAMAKNDLYDVDVGDGYSVMSASALLREAAERLGHDGIIMDANKYFGRRKIGSLTAPGMKGIYNDTRHYLPFKPNQIKSAIGNVGTYTEAGNILLSVKPYDNIEDKANWSKVAEAAKDVSALEFAPPVKITDAGLKGLKAMTTVKMTTTGSLKAKDLYAKTPAEAASLLAHIRKSAQENLYIVPVDKKGKVLEVHRYTKGVATAAHLKVTDIVGYAAGIKGATRVYVAHNHPTKTAEPSREDIQSMGAIVVALDMVDIEVVPLIIAGTKWVTVKASPPSIAEQIPGVVRKKKIPIRERIFALQKAGPNAGNSAAALGAKVALFGADTEGFMLVNAKLDAVGFYELPKGETVAAAAVGVIRALERTNANGVIFFGHQPLSSSNNRERLLINLHKAMGMDLPIFDVITGNSSLRDLQSGHPIFSGAWDPEVGYSSLKVGGTVLSVKRREAKPWYSQMQKVLESKLPGSADPAQLKQLLQSWAQKGEFKAEELDWSGVNDWLATRAHEIQADPETKMARVTESTQKITKAEILEYLAANNVQLQEVEKGDPTEAEIDTFLEDEAGEGMTLEEAREYLRGEEDRPKYGQYQLPGGENYREVLLTLPTKLPDGYYIADAGVERGQQYFGLYDKTGKLVVKRDSREKLEEYAKDLGAVDGGLFRSSHWDEPNVIAHIRFNERTGPNGEKILFIEEVQSDWMQRGRKEGFRGEPLQYGTRIHGYTPAGYTWEKTIRPNVSHVIHQLVDPSGKVVGEGSDRIDALKKSGLNPSVPDAPFKKTWPMLAMKRMVRYAAENGFDQIAWTPGEVQAERYDLSKQVDEITYRKRKDGKFALGIYKDKEEIGQPAGIPESVEPQGLEKYLGKDIAKKIVEGGDSGSLSGLDLKVGGEGMKGFYDRMLVSEVNKFFGKKTWGSAKVETTELHTQDYSQPEDSPYVVIDDSAQADPDAAMDESIMDRFQTRQEAEAYIKENLDNAGEYRIEYRGPATKQAWSLPITRQMRDKALSEGMPLFSAKKKPAPFVAPASPSFKKWFRDSKVVDEAGNPKVMYHSTDASEDFEIFERGRSDIGIHFGTDEQANDRLKYRGRLGEEKPSGQRLYSGYLKIENPLRVHDAGTWDPLNLPTALQNAGVLTQEEYSDLIRYEHEYSNIKFDMEGAGDDLTEALEDLQTEFAEEVVRLLKSKGYDGIVYKNQGEIEGMAEIMARIDAVSTQPGTKAEKDKRRSEIYEEKKALEESDKVQDSYIVFYPNQIKSVWNRGTWDPKAENILLSVKRLEKVRPPTEEQFKALGVNAFQVGHLGDPDAISTAMKMLAKPTDSPNIMLSPKRMAEQKWAEIPYDQTQFFILNNRLVQELKLFEAVFGPSEKTVIVPGLARQPARSIKSYDLLTEIYRVIDSGEAAEIMDRTKDPKKLAEARKLSTRSPGKTAGGKRIKSPTEEFIRIVEMLRNGALLNEEGVGAETLGNNAKAGRSFDLLLATCDPTEQCRFCYAAASMLRQGTIDKAFRNTFHILLDPIGWAKKAAAEAAAYSRPDLPFIRLQGSGDFTTAQQLEGYNALAHYADRAIHIFSRHHEMLRMLKGTSNAPFLKVGSIDATLYEYYGKRFLEANARHGIANAWLYTSEKEIVTLQELIRADSLGLILAADPKLHKLLPTDPDLDLNLRVRSCPCDAEERYFISSCRQCGLSQMGCFTAFAKRGIDAKGKVWRLNDPKLPRKVFPVLAFMKGAEPMTMADFILKKALKPEGGAMKLVDKKALIKRAAAELGIDPLTIEYSPEVQSYLDVTLQLLKDSMKKTRKQIDLFVKDEKNYIVLYDRRFPGDEIKVTDLQSARDHLDMLQWLRDQALMGKAYLIGGEIQRPIAIKSGELLAQPELMGKEDAKTLSFSVKTSRGFDPDQVREANRTSRPAGVGAGEAKVPRIVKALAKEGERILDFGAGKKDSEGVLPHAESLRKSGFEVEAYEFGENFDAEVHSGNALSKRYDIAYANDVANVQATPSMFKRTVAQMSQSVSRKGGRLVVNMPAEPRKGFLGRMTHAQATDLLRRELREIFTDVDVYRDKDGKRDREVLVATGKRSVALSTKLAADRVKGNPDFEKWFGDSKIVDAKGNPKVLYHGSPYDIDAFKTRRSKSANSLGAYFTEDPLTATKFGKKLYPVFLSLQNPLDLSALTDEMDLDALADAIPGLSDDAKADVKRGRWRGGTYTVLEGLDREFDLIPKLKAKKYDSIIFPHSVEGKTYVAFRPNQIKSIWNRGTYETTQGNIMLSTKKLEWHRQIEEVLEKKLPNKGSAKSMLFAIDAYSSKGEIKVEELEWSGLLEWLEEDLNRLATKDEVLEFLRQNRYQVEEVIKGGVSFWGIENQKHRAAIAQEVYDSFAATTRYLPWSEEKREAFFEALSDASAEYVSSDNRGFGLPDLLDDFIIDFNREHEDLHPQLVLSVLEGNYAGASEHATQYEGSGTTLPGGTGYRELIMTGADNRRREIRTAVYSAASGFLGYIEAMNPEFKNNFEALAIAAQTWERTGHSVQKEEVFVGDVYESSHWHGIANPLVHIRFNERIDVDGRKVLFLEELQSDWHQEGRRGGYKGGEAVILKLLDKYPKLPKEPGDWSLAKLEKAGVSEEERDEWYDARIRGRVPDAPFKQTWAELGIKRMVRWAVDNGFDRIAWTPGQIQAERYDLRKQVGAIMWEAGSTLYGRHKLLESERVPTIDLYYVGKEDLQEHLAKGGVPLEDLHKHVGKEVAQKITEQHKIASTGTIEGEDLAVGGEGMLKFYDQMLVAKANKMFDKATWGKARVSTTEIEVSSNENAYHIGETGEGSFYIADQYGEVQYFDGKEIIKTIEEADALLEELNKTNLLKVWSLDVTDQMRAKAKDLPLFSVKASEVRPARHSAYLRNYLEAVATPEARRALSLREAGIPFWHEFHERHAANGRASVKDIKQLYTDLYGPPEKVKIGRHEVMIGNRKSVPMLMVKAYHGSRDFDQFSIDYVGTGEKAQAFGWGLYFTDLKSVAKHYAKKIGGQYSNMMPKTLKIGKHTIIADQKAQYVMHTNKARVQGYIEGTDTTAKEIADSIVYEFIYQNVVNQLREEGKVDIKAATKKAAEDLYNAVWNIDEAVHGHVIDRIEEIDEEAQKGSFELEPAGKRTVYKVTLFKDRDPSEYKFLDWYEQIDKKTLNDLKALAIKENLYGINRLIDETIEELENTITKNFYNWLVGGFTSAREASMFLLRGGIQGIRYPVGSLSGGVQKRHVYKIAGEKIYIPKKVQDQLFYGLDRIDSQKYADELMSTFRTRLRTWVGKLEAGEELAGGLGIDIKYLDHYKKVLDAINAGTFELEIVEPQNYVVFDDSVISIEQKYQFSVKNDPAMRPIAMEYLKMLEDTVPPQPVQSAGAAAATAKISEDLLAQLREEVRERMKAAEGIPVPRFIDKGKKAILGSWHSFTRSFADLDNRNFGDVTNILRLHREAPDNAVRRAMDVMVNLLDGLDHHQYTAFRMKLIMDDMAKDIESGLLAPDMTKGETFPFGFADVAEVKAFHKTVTDAVAGDAKVDSAVRRRTRFNRQLKELLVKHSLLDEKVLADDRYFHHQVLEYRAMTAQGDEYFTGAGLGQQALQYKKKGWQLARKGSLKEYNTDYAQAEYEVIAQAFMQLETRATLARLRTVADFTAKAKEMAKLHKAATGEKKDWKEFIPDTHIPWKPMPGSAWYKASTITDRILDKVLSGDMVLGPEHIREMFVKGRDVEWYIPRELAKTLNEFGAEFNDKFWMAKLSNGLQSRWKAWTLISPLRVLKYNINNMSGDADITFAYNPLIFKYFPKALKDLSIGKWGEIKDEDLKKELEMAKRLGVIGSGWSVQELTQVTEKLGDVKALKALFETPSLLQQMMGAPKGAAKGYWEFAKNITEVRENILRLAAFRHFLKEIAAGKTVYAASKRSEIDKIADPYERAAKLSRELVGDYGNISEAGRWIRRHLIPFWSWMEVNAPRYVRLIANVRHEGQGSTAATAGRAIVGTAVSLGLKGTILGAKLAALAVMINLFNHTFFPDEEDELTDDQKRQLHLILGRRKDGSVITLRIQGALSDAMSFFGGEDIASDIRDYRSGRKSAGDLAKEAALATPKKLFGGLRPEVKAVYELLTRKSLYPDPENPRAIRDRWEYVARTFSLNTPYLWLTGRPQRGGDLGSQLINNLMSLGLYSSDPGESAYYNTMAWAHEYLEKMGEDTFAFTPTQKSNYLYWYKQGLKFGDLKAAEKYLKLYAEEGGTPKQMEASVKRAHPLNMIPSKFRAGFQESLSPEQLITLERAINWYFNTYEGPGRDSISFPEPKVREAMTLRKFKLGG